MAMADALAAAHDGSVHSRGLCACLPTDAGHGASANASNARSDKTLALDKHDHAHALSHLVAFLPTDLLLNLWPAERILSGILACKVLRQELSKIAVVRPVLTHGLECYMYVWACSLSRHPVQHCGAHGHALPDCDRSCRSSSQRPGTDDRLAVREPSGVGAAEAAPAAPAGTSESTLASSLDYLVVGAE
eukprot:Tamp_21103.p1 GENE.Tamp_21103~~Tamp_21103.p1  ORF type:complete len:199 (+),score=23.07 Tamp_21103:30-599(+)